MHHLSELWREGTARAKAQRHEAQHGRGQEGVEGQAGGTHAWGEEGRTEGMNGRRGREAGGRALWLSFPPNSASIFSLLLLCMRCLRADGNVFPSLQPGFCHQALAVEDPQMVMMNSWLQSKDPGGRAELGPVS